MSVITGRALAALLNGIAEGEMVCVHIKDVTGLVYQARICELVVEAPEPFVNVEAIDGEVVFGVPLRRIRGVDVRPFRRYSGYGARQFISDFGGEP